LNKSRIDVAHNMPAAHQKWHDEPWFIAWLELARSTRTN
jgi:hypothetical protein